MENKIEELEKELRGFLTLGINGEYYTHTNPAIIADRLVKLFDLPVVSGSANAELIAALNNTLLANKAAGTYTKLEKLCIAKLIKLVDSIDI